MEQKNKTFHYTYSAKQQDELRAIREKYQPKEDEKMVQLRKLDASADRAGTVAGLAVGLIGMCMFGLGMFFSLRRQDQYFVMGIVIGVIGMVLMGIATPLSRAVTHHRREQIAPEVLRLADELEQEQENGGEED